MIIRSHSGLGQLVVAQTSGGLNSQPWGRRSETGLMQGACSSVVRDATVGHVQDGIRHRIGSRVFDPLAVQRDAAASRATPRRRIRLGDDAIVVLGARGAAHALTTTCNAPMQIYQTGTLYPKCQ